MASSVNTSALSSDSRVVIRRAAPEYRYRWPSIYLNVWVILMIIISTTILGVFANFIAIQTQLHIRTPWLFPYWITSASLALGFIIMMLYLVVVKQLLPGVVLMGCFILSLLWLVGIIDTTLELWVLNGGVYNHCRSYVNEYLQTGKSVHTYAWLEQRSICQCWIVVWVFGIVGTGLLVWMQVFSYQVYVETQGVALEHVTI